MITKFLPGWYVIYTKPFHERKIASKLETKIKLFLPITKVLRHWHDRKKMIDVPLFPSYIFVFLKTYDDYYTIRNADVKIYFVRFGNEIARVQEKVVDNLRTVLEKGSDIEVKENNFQIGQQVKISQGVLNGLPCEIAEFKNEKKILVRVNLLNRAVLATIPSLYLVS